MGTIVAETHNRYERELLVGARVRVADRLRPTRSGSTSRTLDGGHRAATQELMFLHVDLVARRVSPFPKDLRRRVVTTAAVRAALPRPGWVGRRIAMPHRIKGREIIGRPPGAVIYPP
jgi:acyl-CoA thioester hydrolase